MLGELCQSDLGTTGLKAWKMYKVLLQTAGAAPYVREDVAQTDLQLLKLLGEADLHSEGVLQQASQTHKVRLALDTRTQMAAPVLQALSQLRTTSHDTDIGKLKM